MEAYPRTLRELDERFGAETACREYLEQIRWPDGFVCPHCLGRRAWRTDRNLWMCGDCGRQTSVTAGTIFQGTRIPMSVWFRAIWWVVSQKNGASALGLQRVLGLGSYRTAWTWLHKLRRAMVRPGREHLDYYLDEFTFRFNRRSSRSRGKLFYRLIEQAVTVEPIPYAQMVKGVRGRKKKGLP